MSNLSCIMNNNNNDDDKIMIIVITYSVEEKVKIVYCIGK